MTYLLCKNGKVSLFNENGFEQFNISKVDRDILKLALSSYAFIVPKVGNNFTILVSDWIKLINEMYDCSNLRNEAIINTLNKIV